MRYRLASVVTLVVVFLLGNTLTAKAASLPATTPARAIASGYPLTPPAPICGTPSFLSGPATAPAGAVTVNPSDNLSTVTKAKPAGTTFWLAPGTFSLGSSQFAQVMPKDNDVYIGAPGAVLDGGGVNRYAFTQKATGVVIQYLTIQNFVPPPNEGAVNAGSGPNWIIQYNTIQNNQGAGVDLGTNNVVSYNCLSTNGQYGYKSTNATNVTLDHNEIANNVTGVNIGSKCGCIGGGKLYGVTGAVVTNNWLHDNKAQAVWADTNTVGVLIEGNYINDNNGEGVFFETSYNGYIHANNLIRNALVKGGIFAARHDSFPIGAIYISESGGDSRLYGGVYSTLEVSDNNLDNNWGGVTLWENANRFCNTATPVRGYCPIAGAETTSTCVGGTIKSAPHLTDCRWQTKNVLVHDNTFSIDTDALGCTGTRCGESSLFSNIGKKPPWSPYLGTYVEDSITFNQNNHFMNNTYIGNWNADVYAQGQEVTFDQWQGAPYNQDTGSTLTPLGG
jgi:hypothetical protein